ncbi:hypothetical protein Q9L42_017790 [Methylomarinum sp. Ch1-1]|uniref:Uncharacterized protein n=1 Tax=Methylomarinum roseum TaxID=3067653 RepID=A0AAU7NT71_9GAMM|nr:hypothetical protein [Methylomarinum sp. Ch1-1]MDP4519807.1 hypothetical protein [Methylomarinum sp. Ch1-1]
MALIEAHPELKRGFELLTGIKGIAQAIAIAFGKGDWKRGQIYFLAPQR